MAVPADRDDQPVREFPSFTEDLSALADWLAVCSVDTVAMESTGTKNINRAAQALKQAAVNLRASQSALGAYYRRPCGRMDKGKAVTACAHKLARLIYTLVTKRGGYVDQGQAHY